MKRASQRGPFVFEGMDMMNNHALAVCAFVRNKAGQILLVKHFRRGWDIPGGFVKPGEDLLVSLQREVAEETRVEIGQSKLVVIYTNVQGEEFPEHNQAYPPKIILAFQCEALTEVLATSRENSESKWVDEAEAQTMIEDQLQLDRLRDLIAASGGVKYVVYQKMPYQRLREQMVTN